MTTHPQIPESCSIAFKEWAGVCDALGSGRQSLILRKGGISEGPSGFEPEHSAFWLYPTFVHEAEQGLRSTFKRDQLETPGAVAIESLAVVEWFARVDRLETLARLAGFHDWTEATLWTRFHYRTPGLWALVVRVYRRDDPWRSAITSAHLGCKTWVPLEDPPPTLGLVALIDEYEAVRRLGAIRSMLEG
jgi:hypothetical protein